jgi:hypothetical protein
MLAKILLNVTPAEFHRRRRDGQLCDADGSNQESPLRSDQGFT